MVRLASHLGDFPAWADYTDKNKSLNKSRVKDELSVCMYSLHIRACVYIYVQYVVVHIHLGADDKRHTFLTQIKHDYSITVC